MPMWLQFIWMVFVGLLGGAMYVNVFYILVKDNKLPEQVWERRINVCLTVGARILKIEIHSMSTCVEFAITLTWIG